MTIHTATLDLPDLMRWKGYNVIARDGWDAAQGDYFWTLPSGHQSRHNPPSAYMIHHTAGSRANAQVGGPGNWSKANVWAGLLRDDGLLYSSKPGTPCLIFTAAGPARVSSGYGASKVLTDYAFRDLRPPWDCQWSDDGMAANRYAFNVETVHPGDGGPLDDGVLEHVTGLGVTLHEAFDWTERTLGHLTWTKRKIDPRWNGRHDAIVPIMDEIQKRLTIPEPIGAGMFPFVAVGDEGFGVESWQFVIGELEGADTSQSSTVWAPTLGLVVGLYDEAMSAYVVKYGGNSSARGIGPGEGYRMLNAWRMALALP